MILFGKNLKSEIPIVAEIGVNHEGSLESAINLITLAHKSGADAVKFQSYTPERFIASNDKERMERIKKFHLNESDHLKLIDHSNNIGIPFFSTAITEDWVSFLAEHTSVIKIASGDINFKPTISLAAAKNIPVIISTGGATLEEVKKAIVWFKDSSKSKDIKDKLILMHCVSSYPTPLENANLNSIKFLQESTGLKVGYSNHVKGIMAPLLSVALGANLIEVHFTDSREGKVFHDHHLSLVPKELAELSSSVPNIKKSLGVYGKFCLKIEKENLLSLRKGIVASKNMAKGKIIEEEDLLYARPSIDLDYSKLFSLLGKEIVCDIEKGERISEAMFKNL